MTNPESPNTKECKPCETNKTTPLSGRYNLLCLQCCTRLVLSAHPSKAQAASLLAAICGRGDPERPRREAILESVKKALKTR